MSISPQLIARIDETFPEALTDRFVDAIRQACDAACENYDEEEGSIPQTFGMDVWAFSTHRLRGVADEEELDIESEFHENRTTLQKNGLYLNSYRVGSSADQNIWESFPNNRNAAPRLAHNNMQTDLFAEQLSGDEIVDLVLAQFSNPRDGLDALYLCIPVQASGNQISAWGYAKCLWRRSDALGAGMNTAPGQPQAPESQISEPALRLRTDRLESDQ